MGRPGQKKKQKHDVNTDYDVLPLAGGEYAYLIGEGKTTHVRTNSEEFYAFIHDHDLTEKIASFANLYGKSWSDVVSSLSGKE